MTELPKLASLARWLGELWPRTCCGSMSCSVERAEWRRRHREQRALSLIRRARRQRDAARECFDSVVSSADHWQEEWRLEAQARHAADIRAATLRRLLGASVPLAAAVVERERLREELRRAYANNEKRNRQLDALNMVWCNGGCSGGVARWQDQKPDEATVIEAVRNTRRLVSWFINYAHKNDLSCDELKKEYDDE